MYMCVHLLLQKVFKHLHNIESYIHCNIVENIIIRSQYNNVKNYNCIFIMQKIPNMWKHDSLTVHTCIQYNTFMYTNAYVHVTYTINMYMYHACPSNLASSTCHVHMLLMYSVRYIAGDSNTCTLYAIIFTVCRL